MQKPKSVDDYIAAQPADIARRLASIRKIVRENAPRATEKISYGMPYYSLNGRLLYFIAHTHHIGFYPMRSAINKFADELTEYETSKGTIRFPYDKPLPLALIKKIVLFRKTENLSKSK